MPDLLSPYPPRVTATFTPGRERQAGMLERVLVGVAGQSTLEGRVQVLQGARGVGKTSVLRAVERTARRLGLSTVFVTAGADGAMPAVGGEQAINGKEPAEVPDAFAETGCFAGAVTDANRRTPKRGYNKADDDRRARRSITIKPTADPDRSNQS